MKANKTFLIAAAIACFTFTACSSDDNNTVEALTINAIEGEYVGEATGTLVTISQTGEQQSHDVTPKGTETATVSL